MQLERAINEIKKIKKTPKSIVIGIEGFGGSGKSTVAAKLAELLGSAYVIGIDDFIVKEKVNEPSWDKGAFDRDRLEKQVLIPA